MVSTLPICPVSPRPLECLSPLVKSLDHWYQQQKPLEPGLGSAFAVFSVHFGPVFISPTSQWCKPHKPSESGHHLALVLLLAGRPLFPCIARFTVIYTPDRWPKCPWISRGTAPAVPSSSLGEDGRPKASLQEGTAYRPPWALTCFWLNPFFLPTPHFSTTRQCVDSSCSPAGHTRVSEDLVGLQSKSSDQLAMLECWSILQAFA